VAPSQPPEPPHFCGLGVQATIWATEYLLVLLLSSACALSAAVEAYAQQLPQEPWSVGWEMASR